MIESNLVARFRSEWQLARGDVPLIRIAIIDETPDQQFLRADFELFRQLFEAHGIVALVADPRELSFDDERVTCAGQRIDLVINLMSDFAL